MSGDEEAMRELALQIPEGEEGFQGKSCQGTGSRADARLVCPRNSKEARAAGQRDHVRDGLRETGSDCPAPCRPRKDFCLISE